MSNTIDPIEKELRALDRLVREAELAESEAVRVIARSTTPDADTQAGAAAGYARGLRRALEVLGIATP